MASERNYISDQRVKKSEKEGKNKQSIDSNLPQWLKKLKSIKHIEIIVAIVVIALLVVAYTYFVSDKDKVGEVGSDGATLTSELQDILSQIKGVGNVKVLIVYNGGKKLEIASKVDKHTNTVTDDGRTTETVTEVISPIIVGGDKPLIIGEVRAEIDGVVVVAQGGDNSDVRVAIMQAMTTLLKIDFNKVQVFEMK